MKHRTVTSLWTGNSLPLLEELRIRSFLDHGHGFQLFTYGEHNNLPGDVIIRDARDILPEAAFRLHANTGDMASFVERFRMKFLAAEGGFWVDDDIICLSDDLPDDDVWFCREDDETAGTGALAFPAHHPLPVSLSQQAECSAPAFNRALKQSGWLDRSAPRSQLYPVSRREWEKCCNGDYLLHGSEVSQAWGICLWGERLRQDPAAWDNLHRHSLAGALLDRHLPGHERLFHPERRKRVPLLVGICSCTRSADRRNACRDTWMQHPQPDIECLFFLGRRTPLAQEPDTVNLWVPDDYWHLPRKCLEFYRFALRYYDFDWLFKCDDDTYVDLSRLQSLCSEEFDLIGDFSLTTRGAPSGGAGYLMNRRTVETFVAHADSLPESGFEDLLFGQLARRLGLRLHASRRLNLGNFPIPRANNCLISCHWCSPRRLRDIEIMRHGCPVSRYRAIHPHWQDDVYFFAHGRYMRRRSACSGNFLLEPDGSLILQWDSWPPENLRPHAGGFANEEGFRLTPLPR